MSGILTPNLFLLPALDDGVHTFGYRSADRLGNLGNENILSLTVDNTAPQTAIRVEEPNYTSEDSRLFVTSETPIVLSVEDEFSGVAGTEYRIDEGTWISYAPFVIAGEGIYTVEYRSLDYLGNIESTKSLTVTVDNSSPVTLIEVGEPQFSISKQRYVYYK